MDGYIEVPHSPSLNVTRITILAWIWTTDSPADQMVLRKGNAYYAYMGAGGQMQLTVFIGGTWHWVYGNIALNDGRWHRWAGVYDGSEIRLYVDGAFDTSLSPVTGDIDAVVDPLRLGTGGGLHNWNGMLDEVQVYGRALTEKEIREDFYRGYGRVLSDCRLSLRMEEGAGAIVHDDSGYGNNGLLLGGFSWRRHQLYELLQR